MSERGRPIVSRQGVRELPLKVVEERFERVRLQRRNADGPVAAAQQFCFGRRKAITFVEDERPGQGVEIQILKNLHHS